MSWFIPGLFPGCHFSWFINQETGVAYSPVFHAGLTAERSSSSPTADENDIPESRQLIRHSTRCPFMRIESKHVQQRVAPVREDVFPSQLPLHRARRSARALLCALLRLPRHCLAIWRPCATRQARCMLRSGSSVTRRQLHHSPRIGQLLPFAAKAFCRQERES